VPSPSKVKSPNSHDYYRKQTKKGSPDLVPVVTFPLVCPNALEGTLRALSQLESRHAPVKLMADVPIHYFLLLRLRTTVFLKVSVYKYVVEAPSPPSPRII